MLIKKWKKQAPEKAEDAKASTPAPNPRQKRYSEEFKRRIVEAARGADDIDEVCKHYGVSRESVRRWAIRQEIAKQKRAQEAEEEAELGHHDGYHPNWREVLRLWKERPGLGPAQIRNQLKREGIRISVSTVRSILEENGYTPPKAVTKDKQVRRFEAVRPLEIVHLDFKHFFINRFKAHLLLFQDDFSRFICRHRLCDSEDMDKVIEAFEECVNRHGKMQTVLTDAGSAFYSWNGINRFQKLLSEEYGVDQIKATDPRTNGKIEAVNKQIEKELLSRQYFSSIAEADEAIAGWIRFYNFERTHMGLSESQVPADRFMPGWDTLMKNGVGKKRPAKPAAADPGAAPEHDAPKKSDGEFWEDVLKLALKKVA